MPRPPSWPWAAIPASTCAKYIVAGDLAHEIDAREIPSDWTTGYVPLGKTRPYDRSPSAWEEPNGQVYRLNPGLVDWAYALTKDTPLPDNEKMRRRRATYVGYPNAQLPPF